VTLMGFPGPPPPSQPPSPSSPPSPPPATPACVLLDGTYNYQAFGLASTATISAGALSLDLGSMGTATGAVSESNGFFDITLGGGTLLDGVYHSARTWSADCTEAQFDMGPYPVTLMGFPGPHDCSSVLDCGWTAAWACPGSATPGTSGWAGNDGSTGYYCCCVQGMPPPLHDRNAMETSIDVGR